MKELAVGLNSKGFRSLGKCAKNSFEKIKQPTPVARPGVGSFNDSTRFPDDEIWTVPKDGAELVSS